MTLIQLYRVLQSRSSLALVLWASCVLAALVVGLMLPTRYTSTAQVFVDLADGSNTANIQVSAAASRSYVVTQLELARSPATAVEVVTDLKLAEAPTWRKLFDEAGGEGDIKLWIAARLQAQSNIRRLAASDIIAISYSAATPEEAQRMANAFADAYTRLQVGLIANQAKDQVRWFDARLAEIRTRLVQVETARSELRRQAVEKGAIDVAGVPEGAVSLPSVLASAKTSLIQAQVALQQAESGQTLANEPLELTLLRRQLADTEVGIARELPLIGPQHRRILNMQANRDQLQSEISFAITRLKAQQVEERRREIVAAEQRVKDLTAALVREERQRDDNAGLRAEGITLDREIDSLRSQIEGFVQRRERAYASTSAFQTNVQVLTTAPLPSSPSSPSFLLIAGVAAILGIAFGFVGAFVVEMFDRRVRCVEDLLSYSNAPVLGTVPPGSMTGKLVPLPAFRGTRFAPRGELARFA